MSRTDRWLVGLSTAAAALASFPFLGRRSIWLDEAMSLRIAADRSMLAEEANMWLYYLLLDLWTGLGRDEWTVRSLSALFAVASVPAIAAVARRLLGSPAAGIASMFLAGNLFFLRYAQEARAYSLVLLLSLLSTLFFLRVLERPSAGNLGGYVATSVAAFYAHFFALLVFAAQGTAALCWSRRPPPWKPLCLAALAGVLLLLPLPMIVDYENRQNVDWIPRPDLWDLPEALAEVAGGRRAALLFALPIAAAIAGLFLRGKDERRWGTGLALTWLVLPPLLAWLFSVGVKPLFVPRYFIVALPGLILSATAGLLAFLPPAAARVGPLLLAAVALPGFALLIHPEESWREVSATILEERRTSDAIVTHIGYYDEPLAYYLERGLPDGAPLPPLFRPEYVDLTALDPGHSRVWLVLRYSEWAHPGATEREQEIRDELERDYRAGEEWRHGLIRVVRYLREPDPGGP